MPAATELGRPMLAHEAAVVLHCTRQTVVNWMRAGCKVSGRVVKLKHETIGARTFTRPEWLDEFKADCQAARDGVKLPPPPPRHDTDRADRTVKAALAAWGKR